MCDLKRCPNDGDDYKMWTPTAVRYICRDCAEVAVGIEDVRVEPEPVTPR